ncbi:RadC family protein [Haloplasma contractile]|uniref:DNA repair protein n=1 Tax=Haloplasma contractile SSD-17B TaxID=1033810 RepID=U2FIV2_9MOLU|nr:DNA repair protein RadC [Haloplasma contractile]ERJ12785.1 DNA repair protein [Haloplasma contractile SSD-17B]
MIHYDLVRDMPLNERPREKFELKGPKQLNNQDLLAILIRTGTKEYSALNLAYEILKKFKTLDKLKICTIDQLTEIKGIGRAKAIQILAAIEIGYRINATELERGLQIKSPSDCAKFLMDEVKNLEQEHFIGIYLDTKNKVLAKKTIFIGSLNRAICSPREVFKEALRHGCASIIVAHNHPSGDPTPSKEDIRVTQRLIDVGDLMGIEVLDHLVVGSQGYISLREEKYI